MFTKNDEKTIDKVMRRVVNEVVSEVVEQKLESKLKPLYDFKNEATSLLKAIMSLLQGKIHPDYQHTSVLQV